MLFPQSQIGKWWSERRGLLTRAIVQLNARAVSLPPSATISCITTVGGDDDPAYSKVGYRKRPLFNTIRTLGVTDLGKILCGKDIDRFESRGKAADKAAAAFRLLSEKGFNLGSDKRLNRIMADSFDKLLRQENVQFSSILCEQKIDVGGLLPDVAVDYGQRVTCVEFTWRKGEFQSSANRAEVSQYILSKLQNYVRQLGWTND